MTQSSGQGAAPQMTFTLPPLPYSFDALEPHIDAKTMEIHHDKHHAAYVTNLNKALEGHADLQALSIEELGIEHIMMATDMPHFDSEYPHTVSTIQQRSDLTAKQKALILGENAQRLLNL